MRSVDRELPDHAAHGAGGRPRGARGRRGSTASVVARVLAAVGLCLSVCLAAAAAALADGVPTISDNTWAGQTLVATPATAGDALEWWQCDGNGQNCADTTVGATDFPVSSLVTGATYYVAEAGTTNATSATTAPIAAAAPTQQTDPTVSAPSGFAVGDTLSVGVDATWSERPDAVGVQWVDCSGAVCTDIPAATGRTYTLGAGDVGDDVEVDETPVYGPTAVPTALAQSSTPGDLVGQTPMLIGAGPQISGAAAQECCVSVPQLWDAMTVVYSSKVATANFSCFFKLLVR